MRYRRLAVLATLWLLAPVAHAAVDINTADIVTLDRELKGIGPKTAKAIVQHRAKHGPFKSVDELTHVKGVTRAMVNKNRSNLTVSRK
jgi:competence protein ComEA